MPTNINMLDMERKQAFTEQKLCNACVFFGEECKQCSCHVDRYSQLYGTINHLKSLTLSSRILFSQSLRRIKV